ncbi:MAG: 4-hydroxy-tetrahydrodipicolinate synthase [Pseudomarimonas sp.]
MQLRGSITALATPFAADGELDLGALDRLIERQIDAGSGGLVIAGSTGEAAMLEDNEFERLLRAAVLRVAGRIPLLAGCGLSGTARTVAQVQRAKACGIDIALVVTPPYVRPTQAGLVAHFACVAEQGGLPVVLYNVPSRSGGDLLPATVQALAALPSIIGIKEALPDAERMQELLALRGPGFAVLSGDDPTAVRAMLAGADGVISVSSNVIPAVFARLCALALDRQASAAADLDSQLQALYAGLAIAPNPIPLKAILAQLRLCADVVRLPLLPLPPELRDGLSEMIATVSALEDGTSA